MILLGVVLSGYEFEKHFPEPSPVFRVRMKPKKGNNWTAFYDPDTKRYFAEIIYTSREGREQYNYEITQDIYNRLGTFRDDVENERLIHTAKRT